MHRIATTLAALIASVGLASAAHAQQPDTKLCESLKAALAKAPQALPGWTGEVDATIAYESGAMDCRSPRKGEKTAVCPFWSRQMASADQCKAFKAPTSEETDAFIKARTYVQARAMPSVTACFPGVQPTPHQKQIPGTQVETGMQFAPPGLATFRLVEKNTKITLLENDMCVMNGVEIQIDALP